MCTVSEKRGKFSRFPEHHWVDHSWLILFTRQRFFQIKYKFLLKQTFTFQNQTSRYLQSTKKAPSPSRQDSRCFSSTSWPDEEIHWHYPHEQDARRSGSLSALLHCLLGPTGPPTLSVHRILRMLERFQQLPRI